MRNFFPIRLTPPASEYSSIAKLKERISQEKGNFGISAFVGAIAGDSLKHASRRKEKATGPT